MTRRVVFFALVAFFAACFAASSISADETSDTQVKLRDVIKKKNEITRKYEEETQKVSNECNEKVEAARKEFHNKRDEYIKDKDVKLSQLKADYKDRVAPLLDEERQLTQALSGGMMNFAKPKAQKTK